MGTIASRDCIRVIELTEQVAAACLLAAVQAMRLRIKQNDVSADKYACLEKFIQTVGESFPFLGPDRPLEHELRDHLDMIRKRQWRIYS